MLICLSLGKRNGLRSKGGLCSLVWDGLCEKSWMLSKMRKGANGKLYFMFGKCK